MKRVRAIHIPELPTDPVRYFLANGSYVERTVTAKQYRYLNALYQRIRDNWANPRYVARETIRFRAIRVRRYDEVFDTPAGTGTRGLTQVTTPASPQTEARAA